MFGFFFLKSDFEIIPLSQVYLNKLNFSYIRSSDMISADLGHCYLNENILIVRVCDNLN